jgi:hypothetical protein
LVDYCVPADLKGKVLQEITPEEEAYDAELTECIITGSALVDGFLKREGLAVPVPFPQLLVDAARYFAAWEFRRRRDPNAAEVYWGLALNTYLQVYIDAEKQPYLGSV